MDSVDIIKKLTQGRDYPRYAEGGDKLISAYYALPLQEGKELAKYALNLEDNNTRRAILTNLAFLVPGSLSDIHIEILERELDHSGKLFMSASDEVCHQVVHKLDQEPDPKRRLDLTQALAWIGSIKAQEKLAELAHTPIDLPGRIIKNIEEIIPVAGWELTSDGKRRNLYYSESYSLNFIDTESLEYLEENCPWCKRPLFVPFDFKISDPRLEFLGLQGDSLRISTCINCAEYSSIFTKVDTQGLSQWSKLNVRPDYLRTATENEIEESWYPPKFKIGARKKSPYEQSVYLPTFSSNQVGGFPDWVQAPEFPYCPSCHRRMIFLAQFDVSVVYYAFTCMDCKMAATLVQAD